MGWECDRMCGKVTSDRVASPWHIAFRIDGIESDRRLIEFQCYTAITALFGNNWVIS
jgi:hypothetical protein